ncbi:TFIIS helical bundle-like domain-containing protein [Hirsutella rhossiliensis]|uniref:TFIIS helical bundle-like domain-containing protein n=1 Tax=Hirsutella rhossiliensis TaxID=111463 RepID=A0A9P8MQ09_9HYPO|nr:TFIIS helical bundle-like domain-containing protein [Hirsutella rhossiliensis]KAH0959049.1 TFIIS helical bundle-like domain-containing protein [Hirsutella rhossiliensis]
MSDADSPARSSANEPVDDGQEATFQDEVAAADSDRDSDLLSEIDENQFEDYDPETANIEDRPVDIDEDIARTLKATKRKRTDGDVPKKPREGRRDKKRRDRDDEVPVEDDTPADTGKTTQRRSRRTEPANEEELSPEERRQRAIDRALDAAIKKGGTTKRRRKDEIDLEDEIDDQLAQLKLQMERACQADNAARESGQPALHKLKLLPDVTAILNRNNVQHAVLDPDTNFLQHVKFFLEPLNDGSLPAYNIQRDIFSALTRLNIEKETLLSSGIGKVVLFYTRSKKPEPSIKRMAERLLGEWSRPILKRTDDYKKRHVETREFDYQAAKLAQRQKAGSQFNLTQRPSQSARDAFLAPQSGGNQARMASLPSSYTIAPKSTFDGSRGQDHRPLGASGMEAFRKMTQKSKKRA